MNEVRVSIGQVKRDISDLVNRVAYGGERVVLTSRGKPKAALVSIEEHERLTPAGDVEAWARWESWQAESEALRVQILARRAGQPLDLGALWQAARADLEEREERRLGD